MAGHLAHKYTLLLMREYILFPRMSKGLKCPGKRGSWGYRCAGDASRVSDCSDSFAIGIMICHAATASMSRWILNDVSAWVNCHYVDNIAADSIFTQFVQEVICKKGNAKNPGKPTQWAEWMHGIWNLNPGFIENKGCLGHISKLLAMLLCEHENSEKACKAWKMIPSKDQT